MTEGRDTLSLVVLYLGAFGSPLIAGRLNMPAAVVEILFGVAVGISGTGWVHPTPFTQFLSQLGFTFLMFLVGMEIDWTRIRQEGPRTVTIAAVVASAILGLGMGLAQVLHVPLFMGLVHGAMSVGILLATLSEMGILKTRLGQLLLLTGSIGEFLALFALTGFNLVHRFGITPWLLVEVGRAFILFLVCYLLLSLLRLLVWWAPHRFQRLVHASDPSEIGVRAGFVLMLLLATLAEQVGLEAILGAFLAGALFSFVFRQKGVLDVKLGAIGQGFFMPIFFIHVGISFNIHALSEPSSLARLVGMLLLASLISKLLPMLLFRAIGVSMRQAFAGALMLCAPLTLLVAMATLGRRLGFLDERIAGAIILWAMLSSVLFPSLFKRVLGQSAKAL